MNDRVLIIGHGTFPEDIVRTAGMVYGTVEGVKTISLPAGQDLKAYQANLREVIEENCKSGILVISDFLGGTPFLTASRVIREFWDEDVEMITGLNLPMLVEIFNNIDTCSISELKELGLEAAKAGIVDFKAAMNNKTRKSEEVEEGQ